MGLPLTDESREFIVKKLEEGLSSTVISRAYQRRFGGVLRPQDIENLRGVIVKKPKRKDVAEIQNKLGSHSDQLEYVRKLLLERMTEEATTTELVKLSAEFRANIVSQQQIATMNDDSGEAQYVLVYGDTVQASSPNADIEDATFTVLED